MSKKLNELKELARMGARDGIYEDTNEKLIEMAYALGKEEIQEWTMATLGPLKSDGVAVKGELITSLVNVLDTRPDVVAASKKRRGSFLEKLFVSNGDPFTVGTRANTYVNDWWNTHGKKEYPNVRLVLPGTLGILNPTTLIVEAQAAGVTPALA